MQQTSWCEVFTASSFAELVLLSYMCINTVAKECYIFEKRERHAKHVAANSAEDSRFDKDHLLGVPSAFPTHEFKYEVNRLRSQADAARHDVGIVYSLANDTPSSEVLRLQPELPT